MEKVQSLAEFLGTGLAPQPELPETRIEDIAGDAEGFCKAVLNSYEFRQYIVHSLTLGSLAPAVLIRIMDLAGWQKPPERIEHSGPDGKPIEHRYEKIERVIIDPPRRSIEDLMQMQTPHIEH